jgi:hypothetical protein
MTNKKDKHSSEDFTKQDREAKVSVIPIIGITEKQANKITKAIEDDSEDTATVYKDGVVGNRKEVYTRAVKRLDKMTPQQAFYAGWVVEQVLTRTNHNIAAKHTDPFEILINLLNSSNPERDN